MRRRALGVGFLCAWLSVSGLPGPVGASHAMNTVTYQVLSFTDPSDLVQEMAFGQTQQATPNTATCSSCPASSPLTYSFLSPPLNATSDVVVPAGGGHFRFWLRTYQPSGVPSVPPGTTRVRFELRTSAGLLMAQASVAQSLTGFSPVAYDAQYSSPAVAVPKGAWLVWNVTIDDGAGLYKREAAPWGVSSQYVFQVLLPAPVPIDGGHMAPDGRSGELSAGGEAVKSVENGTTFSFDWRLRNDGFGPSMYRLALQPWIEGGLTGLRLDPPAEEYTLGENESVSGRVEGTASQVGYWPFNLELRLSGDTSPRSLAQFAVNVTPAAASNSSGPGVGGPLRLPDYASAPSRCPGVLLLLDAATVLRMDVPVPMTSTVACRVHSSGSVLEWSVRLVAAGGTAILRWRAADGSLLAALPDAAGTHTVRVPMPEDGYVTLEAVLEGFRGELHVDAAPAVPDATAESFGGSSHIDAPLAAAGAAVLGLGLVGLLVVSVLRRER